jgi:hypothetical protein
MSISRQGSCLSLHGVCVGGACVSGRSDGIASSRGAMNSSSVTHQMWRKTRLGDHRAVEALVLRGNILITYD